MKLVSFNAFSVDPGQRYLPSSLPLCFSPPNYKYGKLKCKSIKHERQTRERLFSLFFTSTFVYYTQYPLHQSTVRPPTPHFQFFVYFGDSRAFGDMESTSSSSSSASSAGIHAADNRPWVEKYRPKDMSDLLGHEDITRTSA